MVLVNENFKKLPGSYLFSEIARRVKVYSEENPEVINGRGLIRMGIGDVTKPLVPAVIQAMHSAVDEMGDASTFRGYGPEHGYQFLQEKIIEHDYTKRGIKIENDEVFVSDGCKSDMGNIGGIFGTDNVIAVTDPVYPVYVDSNVMEGRGGELNESGNWSKIVYLPCTAENNYEPALPKEKVDIIYLCFPNNPLGTTLNKAQLTKWVEYALKNKSIILYDSAYEAFITEEGVPHSIYEIEDAKYCAIEFRSFSKTAGFTGMRCGYTVIPKEVVAYDHNDVAQNLNPIWNRRQCTKFNGVSYVTQKAAEAVYSKEGLAQCKENIDYYLNNAKIIRESLESLDFKVFGGINAPYIWMKTPNNETSWDFFDILLKDINIVATPGSGFGPCGEGCIRLTAFGTKEETVKAMERIKEWKNKK